VEEDEVDESGDEHQWTTGGVRGRRRLNIGKEAEEDFLEGTDTGALEEADTGEDPGEYETWVRGECQPDSDSSSSEGVLLLLDPSSKGS
jgi:hypothetical protein